MGVTSLLILSTQVIQSQYYLPPVDYATSLDIWLLGCMVMVFGSLVEYSFAYQYAKRQLKVRSKHADTEQAWNIKPSIPNLDVIESGSDYNTTQSSLDSKSFRNKSYEKSKSGTLDRVSRVVFPFIFSSFVTVYWGYFLTKVEVGFSDTNASLSNVEW
ncbi:gamma-aminobutyric acid receptor subunit alpha-5-like [Limulus polyphemus]|uniref:Gamma-aminobutyric acid receptor subunit alpha-5-like n=1 Tax=Limulus polyphemus TaxID=6850 RepID=A0ABM1C2R2_LIMPO|nr:gamma-aminobutyric acid receptor subunit alpha-5-like [Limulus polyphemus]